jgi:hypothetical protein
LPERHPRLLEPVELLDSFDSFGDQGRLEAIGDAAQRLHHSCPDGVGVAVVGEGPVELHDIRLQGRELPQP